MSEIKIISEDEIVKNGKSYIAIRSRSDKEIKMSDVITKKLLDFLGYDGVSFFMMCLEEYNDISPVWVKCGIPHPVHFREGMMIRNFLRGLEETNDWIGHDFDDKWSSLVLSAIALCLGEDN